MKKVLSVRIKIYYSDFQTSENHQQTTRIWIEMIKNWGLQSSEDTTINCVAWSSTVLHFYNVFYFPDG